MLAVVEHDQHPPVADPCGHDLVRAGRWRDIVDPDALGDGDRHALLVGDGHQVDPPDAVGCEPQQLGRDVLGQPGLAGATRARQRDEPVLTEVGDDLGDVVVAADQRGHRHRQVVGQHRDRLQRCELLRAARVPQLVDPFAT